MLTVFPFWLSWSRDAFVSALALSLLHSLWQGAALGAVGWALNARLKRSTPDVRCGAFTALLLTIFAVWLGTFGLLYVGQTGITASSAGAFPTAGTMPPPFPLITPHTAAAVPLLSLMPGLYPFVATVWALGVGALSLRHLGGFLMLHRLCRTLSAPCSPEWEACAIRLAGRLGLRRKFTLRCSEQIDVPFVFGLARPCILLPISALTGLSPQQIEALIAHELAHFAQNDAFSNAIQVCVETVLFYHPVVRWLSLQIRVAREQRCDDLAVQVVGDRAVYARALYSLEEARACPYQLALGAKGDNSMSNFHLVGRIRRILGVSRIEERDSWAKGAFALGIATAITLGMVTLIPAQARVRQQTDKDSPTVVNQVVKVVRFMFNINGDKIELNGTELAPNTLLKVNGKEGRFGDLTAVQQQQLREAVAHMPAIDIEKLTAEAQIDSSSHIGVKTAKRILIKIDGDTIELTGTTLTPDTRVKVNGKEVRVGDLNAKQQEQLHHAMQHVSTMDHMGTHVVTRLVLNLNGDKIELNTTQLAPDSHVTVNGKEGRFGDLTAQQQKEIHEHLASVHVNATAVAKSIAGHGASRVTIVKIGGDTIEMNGGDLTPNSTVTVNGKTGRFGDLTDVQQQHVRQALQNLPDTL